MDFASDFSEIPVPLTARALPRIDPYADPAAYAGMVSILYHAERAALEAFERLSDPAVVERSDIFLGARSMLVADEQAHLKDMEEIIRLVGAEGVSPAPAGFAELWDFESAKRRLHFPLSARVAAMFTLVTESLGYAYLYHLANATSSDTIATLLRANVEDEKRHLQVSMEVLRRALARGERFAFFDLGVHYVAFLLLGRKAARSMRAPLSRLGFDIHIIASSSMRFAWELFVRVAGASGLRGLDDPRLHRLWSLTFSPATMRLCDLLSYAPDPPLLWSTVRGLGRLSHEAPSSPRVRGGVG